MIRVSIIGSGNVALHLIQAFSNNEVVELVEVCARKNENLVGIIESSMIITDINLLKKVDLYIIAVSDLAIAEVSSQLKYENSLVVHTSGSVNIDDLNDKNRKGVFYPLQTFTKNKVVDFKTVPICIEAQNEKDFEFLSQVAHSISNKIFKIDSKQRKALHVSAVFVCNFVNYMFQIGNEICLENQIPFEILWPLIKETAQKIEFIEPKAAQTGPAKRNDLKTIASHLEFLSDENQKNIYSILTNSILENGKEL